MGKGTGTPYEDTKVGMVAAATAAQAGGRRKEGSGHGGDGPGGGGVGDAVEGGGEEGEGVVPPAEGLCPVGQGHQEGAAGRCGSGGSRGGNVRGKKPPHRRMIRRSLSLVNDPRNSGAFGFKNP